MKRAAPSQLPKPKKARPLAEQEQPLGDDEEQEQPLGDDDGPELSCRWLRAVHVDEAFDELRQLHLAQRHARTAKTLYMAAQSDFCNITREICQHFINTCSQCAESKPKPKGTSQQVVKPIIVPDLCDRGQLDLIDMQSQPDGCYRFIGRYQDRATTVDWVFALSGKKAREVAFQLIPILCHVGPPAILHCDNGGEFLGEVIAIVEHFMPTTKIVRGGGRKPWVQGGVERSNGPFKRGLQLWMREQRDAGIENPPWASIGIYVVSGEIMRRHNYARNAVPYTLLYCQQPRSEFRSTLAGLDPRVLAALCDESQLDAVRRCVDRGEQSVEVTLEELRTAVAASGSRDAPATSAAAAAPAVASETNGSGGNGGSDDGGGGGGRDGGGGDSGAATARAERAVRMAQLRSEIAELQLEEEGDLAEEIARARGGPLGLAEAQNVGTLNLTADEQTEHASGSEE